MLTKKDLFPTYETTGISRAQILKIIEQDHSIGWFTPSSHLITGDLISKYIVSLEKLDTYINNTTYINDICAENNLIKTKILSRRQMYLSDLILDYILNYSHEILPKAYHEIYDYVLDHNNPDEEFDYTELILLQKMVKLLLRVIQENRP